MDKLWLALAGAKREHARSWRLTIARCPRLASKTKRWRSPSPRSVWMPAASTTILRFRACSIP
jgi:hypothetical protein